MTTKTKAERATGATGRAKGAEVVVVTMKFRTTLGNVAVKSYAEAARGGMLAAMQAGSLLGVPNVVRDTEATSAAAVRVERVGAR